MKDTGTNLVMIWSVVAIIYKNNLRRPVSQKNCYAIQFVHHITVRSPISNLNIPTNTSHMLIIFGQCVNKMCIRYWYKFQFEGAHNDVTAHRSARVPYFRRVPGHYVICTARLAYQCRLLYFE